MHNHEIGQNPRDLPYFCINFCFSAFIILVQFAGWFFSGSQALLADTAHVSVHAATEVMVIIAIYTGSKKIDKIGSWLIVLLLLLFMVPWLVWEAWERYLKPEDIAAPIMLGATVLGLLGNAAQRLIVRGRGLSIKSADRYKVCLDTDIYSSLGVLFGAGIIYFNPAWVAVDTLIAFAIAVWVIWKVTKMSKR